MAKSNAQRQKEWRVRQRKDGGDPVGRLAEWSRKTLRVPSGHPRAGDRMGLPDFAVKFLRGALATHEGLLCTARKNAKSAITAVLLLGYLVGPLRETGFRGAVASISRGKANELMTQIESIAIASELEGLTFMRSPWPGKVASMDGTVEVLSADKYSGHASGFDLVVVDETGLMKEGARALLAGLRSSTSAKDGRVVHLSIRGDGPFVPELLEDDACYSVLHEAPEGCALDDAAAWRAANPGLGTIKAVSYMEREARGAKKNKLNEPFFRAFDLNQEAHIEDAEALLTDTEWQTLVSRPVPAPAGPYVLGFDAAGGRSWMGMTAYWPQTGRLDCRALAPGLPSLANQAEADGRPAADYELLAASGAVVCDHGYHVQRTAPAVDLAIAAWGLPAVIVHDTYRDEELRTVVAGRARLERRTLQYSEAPAYIEAFRRWALDDGGAIAETAGPLLKLALDESKLRRSADVARVVKRRGDQSRDDAGAAALLAVGFGSRRPATPPPIPEPVAVAWRRG